MLALVACFLTDTSALISSPTLENRTSPNSLKRFFSQPLQALLFWWGCRQASCSGSIRGWWVRRPGRSFLPWDKCLQECVFRGWGKRKAVLLLHLPYANLHSLVIPLGVVLPLERIQLPLRRVTAWRPDSDLPNYRKPNSHFCTRLKVSVALEKGMQSLILARYALEDNRRLITGTWRW